MSDFIVRPATLDDASALGELGALLVRAHHEFDPQRFMRPMAGIEKGYGRFLTSQIGQDDATVMVADREGEIGGYVYVTLEGRSWRELRDECGIIEDIVVRERDRRSGVATLLMNAAMEWIRRRGAPRVLLSTATPNVAAQELFARLGFRRTMIEMTRELERPT
jgi:ribosomal protein S18 acetylase RimI-like enzyme